MVLCYAIDLGDNEIGGTWKGRWLIGQVVGWLTYSRRTEKANTTIAFKPSLIRRDHTNNNEMLKMKTSSAIAVVSTAVHRPICNKSVSQSVRQDHLFAMFRLSLSPYQYIAARQEHSMVLAIGTGTRPRTGISNLRSRSRSDPQKLRGGASASMSGACIAGSSKLERRKLPRYKEE